MRDEEQDKESAGRYDRGKCMRGVTRVHTVKIGRGRSLLSTVAVEHLDTRYQILIVILYLSSSLFSNFRILYCK